MHDAQLHFKRIVALSGSKHRFTRETKETFVRSFVGRETDQRSNRM